MKTPGPGRSGPRRALAPGRVGAASPRSIGSVWRGTRAKDLRRGTSLVIRRFVDNEGVLRTG